MANKKVTELDALTAVSGDDLLLVVNDPAGTAVSKKAAVSSLFSNVQTPTTFNSAVTVAANSTCSANLAVTGNLSVVPSTPAGSQNTVTDSVPLYPVGTIWYDLYYMYIAVGSGPNGIKRVLLSEF